jgi:hypothetical protein
MSSEKIDDTTPPAETHADAIELFRRPFAPGALGFRAMTKKLYLACRLISTLPVLEAAPDIEAVYEDIGDMDAGSFAGLKALYSDARKRAGVAAGSAPTSTRRSSPWCCPIGPSDRQVQAIRRQGKSDLLRLSAATEQWLRNGYAIRMSTAEAVRRDLGAILAHPRRPRCRRTLLTGRRSHVRSRAGPWLVTLEACGRSRTRHNCVRAHDPA